MPAPTHRPTPLTVYLPFNRDCVRDGFVPAKTGDTPPPPRGHWLLVQDQALLVDADGDSFRLPEGERPPDLAGAASDPIWLGTLGNTPCWVAAVPKEAPAPPGSQRETMVPMQGTRLPDELLSLGGMAMQAPLVGIDQRPLPPLRRADRRAFPASGASAARAAGTSTTRTCTRP